MDLTRLSTGLTTKGLGPDSALTSVSVAFDSWPAGFEPSGLSASAACLAADLLAFFTVSGLSLATFEPLEGIVSDFFSFAGPPDGLVLSGLTVFN